MSYFFKSKPETETELTDLTNNITVRVMMGYRTRLDEITIRDTATVADLKAKISQQSGFALQNITVLSFINGKNENKEPKDSDRLKDIGVKNMSTVIFKINMSAGTRKQKRKRSKRSRKN
jgi:hypothetical protein